MNMVKIRIWKVRFADINYFLEAETPGEAVNRAVEIVKHIHRDFPDHDKKEKDVKEVSYVMEVYKCES